MLVLSSSIIDIYCENYPYLLWELYEIHK